MFVGHYSAAFAARAASPRIPLWVLLLAAQLVDVFWGVFVLVGIEHARLDPSLSGSPLDLYHMPWTHSLAMAGAWAVAGALLARRVVGLDGRDAALVGGVVASHWVLDLLVHRPDLTLAGGESKMGLALWNHPVTEFALEIALVALTAWAAASASAGMHSRGSRMGGGGLLDTFAGRLGVLAVGLVLLQVATTFGPLPPSLAAMIVSGEVVYLGVTAAGAWADAARR